MPKDEKRNLKYVYIPVLISAGILLWLIVPIFGNLVEIIGNSHPLYLFISFSFACLSYIFMGVTLREMLNIMGYKMPFWEVSGIAVVSTSVNYFVSSGGVSGFATRAHLLKKRHVPYAISVTVSVVISVLIYFVLSLIILQGILLNLLDTREFNLQFLESIAGVLIILFIASAFIVAFFHADFRRSWSRKAYHAVNKCLFYFSKKEIPRESFSKFEAQLGNGINVIESKKYELPKILFYVAMDWIFTIYILYFAFKSLGVSVETSGLIVGFSFGMLMTVIPFLPGGLGAMEAAMAAAFAQMGVPWDKAVAGALIFRCFYYLIPSFISVIIYWGLKLSEPYRDYIHDRHLE